MRSRRFLRLLLASLLSLSLSPHHAHAQGSSAAAPSASPSRSSTAGSSLADYVGQYRATSNPDLITAIYLDSGILYEESERRARQRLTPDAALGPDRFRIETPQEHLVFQRDSSGAISSFKLVQDLPAAHTARTSPAVSEIADGRTLLEATRFSTAGTRLNHFRDYTHQEAMLPMRDGVHLHAVILRPAQTDEGEQLPFLLVRTPYGVDDYDSKSINQSKPELAASGYIFVYQDVRGRYESEGKFVMNRPIVPHTTSHDIDETTDAFDTIDWLLKNVPGNNGRAGVFGVSYDGFLAMMSGIDAHPAVKAISPQAPMTDVWLGDDFFHNGAFRQSYGFDYVQQMEAQKIDAPVEMKEDTFDFFLKHINFAGAAAAAIPKMTGLPTAKAFLTQPTYTAFWRDMAVQYHLNKVEVPTLEVGGYWDQEDMWGTQAEYAALKLHDSNHEVFLVLGPWNHGGWDGPARKLGATFGTIDFGEPTGTEYRKQLEAPFFEKYLKDRPGFDLADTASFRSGADKWEHYTAWPPQDGFEPARLYLEPNAALTFTAPSPDASVPTAPSSPIAATYIANPADPIPYRHRPIQSTYAKGSRWYTWLVEDQRFVSSRKDLANFETLALDHDVTITGDVTADLFAATTGSDADWIVKLIDVYPDDAPAPMAGYQLMVADEIFRARYLHSFEQPEPLKPGAVNEFKWSLHGADHTFLKGHRIMVEVQSSWFPLYDRNPQTFVPNIMTAPAGAYKAETVTIYSSTQYPSHLEFEVAR